MTIGNFVQKLYHRHAEASAPEQDYAIPSDSVADVVQRTADSYNDSRRSRRGTLVLSFGLALLAGCTSVHNAINPKPSKYVNPDIDAATELYIKDGFQIPAPWNRFGIAQTDSATVITPRTPGAGNKTTTVPNPDDNYPDPRSDD